MHSLYATSSKHEELVFTVKENLSKTEYTQIKSGYHIFKQNLQIFHLYSDNEYIHLKFHLLITVVYCMFIFVTPIIK